MNSDRKSLPSDCWERIFNHLGDEDLKAVSLTCKDFLAYSNPSKKRLKVVHPQISVLSRHLNRFSRLETVDLVDFEGNMIDAIREIACSGLRLEALHTSFPICLSEFRRYLVDEDWASVSELYSNLKDCSFIGDFDNSCIDVVANNYPNLEQLRFHHHCFAEINRPTSLGLELLATKLKFLRKIYLSACIVSDRFVVALSLNCVFLRDVTMLENGDRAVNETSVAHLLRNRPNLEALSIQYIVKDRSVSRSPLITIEDSIGHAKALTCLLLGGIRNTDKVLMAIAKAKLRLNSLGLISCRGLTGSGLLLVLSNHLAKLRVERTSITDEDMEVLLLKGDVGKLTHVSVSCCRVSSSTLFLLSTKCPSLVEIKMTHTKLDAQVQNVPSSYNRKIQSLRLAYGAANDKLVKLLGLLYPNLKVLDLSDCLGVTGRGIKDILKSCKNLRELILQFFIEGKIFKANDSEFPELSLEVLKLSYSNIDDEGLAVIAKKFPRLVSLDLSNCRNITTKGIKQVVQNIKTLTCLNVRPFDFGALSKWMLSTGNLASLKKIFLQYVTKEEEDQFLQHGCLLLTQPQQ